MRFDEASRALDVALAERVLELPICDSSIRLELPNQCSRFGTPHWSRDGHHSDGSGADELPRLSTEMGAAWLLVEKLASRGLRVSVMNRYAPMWGCFIIKKPGASDEQTAFETAETPALAVCRAVLSIEGITVAAEPNRNENATTPEGVSGVGSEVVQ